MCAIDAKTVVRLGGALGLAVYSPSMKRSGCRGVCMAKMGVVREQDGRCSSVQTVLPRPR